MALPADARPKGTVVSVRGSVIDVRFDEGTLPAINEALEVRERGSGGRGSGPSR